MALRADPAMGEQPSEGPGLGFAALCSVSPATSCSSLLAAAELSWGSSECLWKPILSLGLKLPIAICFCLIKKKPTREPRVRCTQRLPGRRRPQRAQQLCPGGGTLGSVIRGGSAGRGQELGDHSPALRAAPGSAHTSNPALASSGGPAPLPMGGGLTAGIRAPSVCVHWVLSVFWGWFKTFPSSCTFHSV